MEKIHRAPSEITAGSPDRGRRSPRTSIPHRIRGVPERVLSPGELNRALLARQLLLDRTERSPVRAMERMAGIQNQYAPSGYIGLWSRVRDFRRDSLTRAMERGQALTGTLMRITIHTVSARDYPLFAEGVRTS